MGERVLNHLGTANSNVHRPEMTSRLARRRFHVLSFQKIEINIRSKGEVFATQKQGLFREQIPRMGRFRSGSTSGGLFGKEVMNTAILKVTHFFE
jgi:hypothetical protein